MALFHFEKLDVYQLARELVIDIYKLQSTFPREEKYGLSEQIRRASISITSNIAEGMGRFSPKEQLYHVSVAYGSLAEVWSQLDVAVGLGYIEKEEQASLLDKFNRVAIMLSKLRKSIQDKLSS